MLVFMCLPSHCRKCYLKLDVNFPFSYDFKHCKKEPERWIIMPKFRTQCFGNVNISNWVLFYYMLNNSKLINVNKSSSERLYLIYKTCHIYFWWIITYIIYYKTLLKVKISKKLSYYLNWNQINVLVGFMLRVIICKPNSKRSNAKINIFQRPQKHAQILVRMCFLPTFFIRTIKSE